jgi:hypothetical protein
MIYTYGIECLEINKYFAATQVYNVLYDMKQVISRNLKPCDDICTKFDTLYYMHCGICITCFDK